MPEEAPQDIADLVGRCTGDVEERPDAGECAEIIAPYVRASSLRTTASQPNTPGAGGGPRRTSSSGSGGEAGGTAAAVAASERQSASGGSGQLNADKAQPGEAAPPSATL